VVIPPPFGLSPSNLSSFTSYKKLTLLSIDILIFGNKFAERKTADGTYKSDTQTFAFRFAFSLVPVSKTFVFGTAPVRYLFTPDLASRVFQKPSLNQSAEMPPHLVSFGRGADKGFLHLSEPAHGYV
jgi:hypothetical protein